MDVDFVGVEFHQFIESEGDHESPIDLEVIDVFYLEPGVAGRSAHGFGRRGGEPPGS